MTPGDALRLVAVMVLWAACYPLIAAGLDLAPHVTFAALRAAIAGAVLVALGLALGRRLPAGRAAWGLVAIAGLGATGLGFLGMFHAAEFVAPGIATVVANTQPILAAVLGERLGAAGWLGLAAGFAGIALIAWPGLAAGVEGAVLGLGYVMLAAAGVSVGNIAIKRLAGRSDPAMAMGAQLLVGAVALALLAGLTERPAALAWSGEFALVVLTLALFGSALAFWLWAAALRRVPLNRANAFTFLVPILGLAMGAAFYGERLGLPEAAGAALVVAGIALVQRDGGRRRLDATPADAPTPRATRPPPPR